MTRIEVVGLDADDTLWHSEDGFHDITGRYLDLVAPFARGRDRDEVAEHLAEVERMNLGHFGYGVKAFTLSMVEAAIDVTHRAIPTSVLPALVALGKELLARPVELLPGVADTIPLLAASHRLLLITKGDLLHQERKIQQCGLAHYFEELEIVTEKDPATYLRILHEHEVRPEEFLMVGNSVKSDVLPVLAIGGRAVHIPYEYLWAQEHAEHDGSVPELASITQLPSWLSGMSLTD
ncbi:MAG: HAD family hydrolase [Acidimicrobiia bacterium]